MTPRGHSGRVHEAVSRQLCTLRARDFVSGGIAVRVQDTVAHANWFRTVADARAKISAWRDEYNGERPHSSLGYRTPNEFAEVLKSSVMTG
jgi:transposase InsO family protein